MIRSNWGFWRAVLILAIFAIVVACVNTKSTYLLPSEQKYPEVHPDEVRIYLSESDLDTLEYVKVAIIEATGESSWTSQTGMYNAIRKKAGKLGCNGVLMPEIKEPGAGTKVAAAFLGTGAERKGNAVAIRVIGKKQNEADTTTIISDSTNKSE